MRRGRAGGNRAGRLVFAPLACRRIRLNLSRHSHRGHFVRWRLDRTQQCHAAYARHTAATWLMQNGAPLWEAAGYLGMSEKTLRETYGHHHPDFMRGAVEAIGRKPARREKLAESLAGTRRKKITNREVVENIGGARSRSRTRLRRHFPANKKRTAIFSLCGVCRDSTFPLAQVLSVE